MEPLLKEPKLIRRAILGGWILRKFKQPFKHLTHSKSDSYENKFIFTYIKITS